MRDLRLVTRRLALRPLGAGDTDALTAVLTDPIVMRHVGRGAPLEREEVEVWIRRSRQAIFLDGTGLRAVTWASTGELIGYCGIEPGEDTGELELNYGLARAVWGLGLGFEAAAAVVEDADGFVDTLLATVDPANVASVRILERLGFTRTHAGHDVHGLPTLFFRRDRPC
jgi:[ribosomal protein S5]-alanine N-acetyltransferase